jgi:hypothetical protein
MAEDPSKTQLLKAFTNGHKLSLGNVLTILGMLAAVGASWATLSADNADTKRRVQTVEERVKEDRRESRAEQKEIKADVKDVKSEVTQIRILLERMQRSK